MIIFKWILKKLCVKVGTGFDCKLGDELFDAIHAGNLLID
jgi:pheromone shutdown protein TraB